MQPSREESGIYDVKEQGPKLSKIFFSFFFKARYKIFPVKENYSFEIKNRNVQTQNSKEEVGTKRKKQIPSVLNNVC